MNPASATATPTFIEIGNTEIGNTEIGNTEIGNTTSTALELIWEAPNRKVFGEFNFKRELFLTATSFHRPFFKQNNTGVPQEEYAPRLEAFKDAFKEWNRSKYGGKWSTFFYRDELTLAFDKDHYNRSNGQSFAFYAIPNTDKYGPHSQYKLAYEFWIETETELQERADEYICDNICNWSAKSLLNNIREGITKEAMSVDYADLAETHTTEKDFNETECPCCFEPLAEDPVMEGGFLGKCGHCVCVGCLKSLINTQRSHMVCPMCRDDWECYNVVENEKGEYTIDDMEALREDENYDVLLEIIDIVGLREYLSSYYGWEEILGEEQGMQTEYNDYYYSVSDYTITVVSENILEVF